MNWYEKRRTLLLGLYAGLISIGIVFSRSFSNLALEVCEAAAEAATFQARPPSCDSASDSDCSTPALRIGRFNMFATGEPRKVNKSNAEFAHSFSCPISWYLCQESFLVVLWDKRRSSNQTVSGFSYAITGPEWVQNLGESELWTSHPSPSWRAKLRFSYQVMDGFKVSILFTLG